MRLVRTTTEQFILLHLNLVHQRYLFAVETKLEESIIENNNQINSTVVTIAWVLSTEWIRTERGQVQDWYPNEQLMVVPVCLNARCYSSESAGTLLRLSEK